MKKPCIVVERKRLESGEDKIKLYFPELKLCGNLIIDRTSHSRLFNEMIDRQQDGLTFDFLDLNLSEDNEKVFKDDNINKEVENGKRT